MTATDSAIALQETGRYEFRLGSANCQARVTRTRTFSRVVEVAPRETPDTAGAPGPSTPTPPSAQAGLPPAPEQESGSEDQAGPKPGSSGARGACSTPGEGVEIQMPRLVQWLEPGGRVRLTPQLVDADGCVLRRSVFAFRLEPATTQLSVDEHSGLVQVRPDAEQGSYPVVISSGSVSKVVEIPVVSKEGMAALLRAPSDAAPLSLGDAKPEGGQSQVGSAATAAEDSASRRKWMFAALASFIVLGLAGLGIRLLRTGTRPGSVAPPTSTAPLAGSALTVRSSVDSPERAAPARPEARPSEPVIQRPTSGPPPKPSSERPAPPVGPESVGVCPHCGARYDDGSLFCGLDGVRLNRTRLS